DVSMWRFGMAALVLVGGWVGAVAAAGAEGIDAGLWEVTTRVERAGSPPGGGVSRRCLKPDDVANLEKTFSPAAQTINSACERAEHESSPSRLKWRLVCKGQMDMDVSGEFSFDRPDH